MQGFVKTPQAKASLKRSANAMSYCNADDSEALGRRLLRAVMKRNCNALLASFS